ncbi:MAG: hypothetical protein WAO24_03870 [Peptococcia bacterium]
MTHWLAGIAAAVIAWLINRFLVNKGGERAVIWLIPPVEEILKTGSALLLGALLPLSHGVFGLLEAVYDYVVSPRWGFWAGLSSIITHFLLGWATVFIYGLYHSWILSVAVATLLHILWNFIVISLMNTLVRIDRK